MIQGGNIIHKDLSYKIVGVLFDVYNDLGYGYQEKIYERAIAVCFDKLNISYARQKSFLITFKEEIIGRYYLDFLVENRIVLELKRGSYFSRRNIGQIKGYLKVTGLKLAILAQFTPNGVKTFRALNPHNDIEYHS